MIIKGFNKKDCIIFIVSDNILNNTKYLLNMELVDYIIVIK